MKSGSRAGKEIKTQECGYEGLLDSSGERAY